MADEYGLMGNESVILKEFGTLYGGDKASTYTGEIVLTNFNIICLKRGAFNKVKALNKYPIHQIKMYNGRPQALKGKSSSGFPSLDVYFMDGNHISFVFTSANKRNIDKFINGICSVLGVADTGQVDNDDNPITDAIKEVGENFAEVGKGILGAIGIKAGSGKGITGHGSIVNKKCISCAAPLSGSKGSSVKCKYCDTVQTL